MWPGAQGLFNHHNSSCLRIINLPHWEPHRPAIGTPTLDGLVWAVAAANCLQGNWIWLDAASELITPIQVAILQRRPRITFIAARNRPVRRIIKPSENSLLQTKCAFEG